MGKNERMEEKFLKGVQTQVSLLAVVVVKWSPLPPNAPTI